MVGSLLAAFKLPDTTWQILEKQLRLFAKYAIFMPMAQGWLSHVIALFWTGILHVGAAHAFTSNSATASAAPSEMRAPLYVDAMDGLKLVGGVEEALNGPVPCNMPARRQLLFSFLAKSASERTKLNAPIVFKEHEVVYLVVYVGGWCLLNPRQATYLSKDSMKSIGLGTIRIRQVHILPKTLATAELIQATLGGKMDAPDPRFMQAVMRVRAGLQESGFGLREVGSSAVIDARRNSDITELCYCLSVFDKTRDNGMLPSTHLRCLSDLIHETTTFSYGAMILTVADLFDRMLDHNTFASKGNLNLSLTLTPELMREMLRYMCYNVRGGYILHLEWRSIASVCSAPISYTETNLDLKEDTPMRLCPTLMVSEQAEQAQAASVCKWSRQTKLDLPPPSDVFCPFLKGAFTNRFVNASNTPLSNDTSLSKVHFCNDETLLASTCLAMHGLRTITDNGCVESHALNTDTDTDTDTETSTI